MPVKYIPYYPDPIEGQAILDNFSRTLKYKDSYEVKNKLKRGMPFYELEKIEQVGSNKNNNMLIRGECLSACAYLKDKNIKVDLVYIDPPFASGANYAKKIYLRRNPTIAEKILEKEQELKNGKELDLEEIKRFEENMYGDIWRKEDYLNWMYENLSAIKSIMSDTASIYVHLDWHIGHYVKILMDEIFGEENFINEIIWSYRSGGASKKETLPKKHDVIYFYRKTEMFNVNSLYERQYLEKPFMDSKQDEKGRFYVDTLLRDVFEGIINIVDENKLYQFNTRPVLNLSKEQLNYATQKPEGLLELLLTIATNENMIVADFFGGSGVTADVANKLNRRFIHVDVGINSIQTARDRLIEDKAEFDILEIKDGVSLYRNPQQTMDKLKVLINGVIEENTLDDFWFGAIMDSKNGLVPIYVPNLIDSSFKIMDLTLIKEIVYKHIPNLSNDIKKVIIYYIDVEDFEDINKFIKEDNSTLVEIEFKDLKEYLDDIVAEDYAEYTINKVSKDLSGAEYQISIEKFISDRVIQKIEKYNQNIINQSTKSDKKISPINISGNGLELIEYISLDCSNDNGFWKSDIEIKIDKDSKVILNGKNTKEYWNGKINSVDKPLRMKIRNICGDENIYIL